MNYGAWVLLLNHVAKSPYTKPRSKITLHAVSGWASHRPVKAKKKKKHESNGKRYTFHAGSEYQKSCTRKKELQVCESEEMGQSDV